MYRLSGWLWKRKWGNCLKLAPKMTDSIEKTILSKYRARIATPNHSYNRYPGAKFDEWALNVLFIRQQEKTKQKEKHPSR
ncbi:protein of unknown function [Xenorhabdus poinarii G6]|uniref:Uncharacterized protein n=1 Tax=Xenorhabdus poinarii G6 TaxID=1354304 RepID=A0A068R3F9_9GAMM|nr:protein of unknown function [Xenorhabdus poinarii G6]